MYARKSYRLVISFLVFAVAAIHGVEAQEVGSETDRVLSLNAALVRVLQDNPRLAAFGSDIRAADARRIQAGLRPNPQLGLDIEELRFGDSPSSTSINRAGDGSLIDRTVTDVDNAGFGGSEFTLGVSQLIELGGKRARRIDLADEDRQVAIWDYEIARAEVTLEARRAYLEIVAGQEQVQLRRDLLELAETAAGVVNAQVTAGKVTPLLGNRARVEISQARIEFASAERALEAARYRLAMLWGAEEPDFVRVGGDLYSRPSLPELGELERRLLTRPDLSRWATEIARQEAVVALERTLRVPDLTVSLGWRAIGLPDSSASTFDSSGSLSSRSSERFDDGLDHSVVLGFSIPLPLFHRNQGSIREAEILVGKAAHERREAFLGISRTLTTLYKTMEALHTEVVELEEQILPTATATFEATQQGFEQGKFPYLDVLDTQRTLFEAKNQYVDALAELHQAAAEMERFLGESISIDVDRNAGEDTHHEDQ